MTVSMRRWTSQGLSVSLRGIESGAVRVTVRDLTQPSPLALEVLSARPYAFLDDAPLEERRTQAVMARRWMSPSDASDLGRLDPEAIARVRSEAWPEPENPDELHDALLWLGFLTGAEVQLDPRWSGWLGELADQKRAGQVGCRGDPRLWIAAERLALFRALWPQMQTTPALVVPPPYDKRDLGRMTRLLSRSGVAVWRGSGRFGWMNSRAGSPSPASECAVRLLPWRPKVLQCAGASLRKRMQRNGVSAGSCHASTTTRSNGCAPKSSRSLPRDFLRFLFDWQHILRRDAHGGTEGTRPHRRATRRL